MQRVTKVTSALKRLMICMHAHEIHIHTHMHTHTNTQAKGSMSPKSRVRLNDRAILNDWSADKIEAGRQGRKETCQKVSACVCMYACMYLCVYLYICVYMCM